MTASLTGQAPTKPPLSEQGEQLQMATDHAKGAAVHSFPADASPAEKAALARKTAAALAPVDMSAAPAALRGGKEAAQFKDQGGAAVVSDQGTGGGGTEATTTGLREVEALSRKEKDKDKVNGEGGEKGAKADRAKVIEKSEGRVNEDGTKNPPGAMPEKEAEKGKVREIPSWFAIGWTGQDKTLFLSPTDARERSLLADFVSDAYFGAWYHNAGIIVFAVLGSHFVTLLGGGFGWLVVILAVCATYYQTSIKRVRTNARDDLAREVQKKGLMSDVESAGWINAFMQRFWLIYEPVLSATIVASVDQVLSVSTPGFLDSIRMTTFTLGTKPPLIDHVKTFVDTEEDVVLMEWAVSFTPNDLSDLTHAQLKKKVNPKVVLEVRIGAGVASVGKDIVVEDLMFKGTMRVKLKLMNNYPHVQTVDLSFMQPPVFDFVLKPVGFDISLIPGLSNFITSTVHSSLAPMMYHPNVFTLNLEQMLSGAPIDTAVGVLAVTVHSARGLKGTKLGGGAPDPYVAFSISGRAELARTKVKKNTSTPHWNETQMILLNSLNDSLTMSLFDWNEHRNDAPLGTVAFDLKSLAEDGEQLGLTGEVLYDGKPRGQVRFDVNYYPVLQPTKLADGTEEPVPETNSGVVRLVIHQAKDLDPRGQQINPFFRVTLNGKPAHRSQTLKRTPNPIWERPVELLITSKQNAVIGLTVLDDNTLVSDTRLGTVAVKLADVLAANAAGNDWFPLSHARSGRVRITATWKPVLMAGAINGAGVYTPPLGVVRLWFKRSKDLKNVEAPLGKSDPYARVLSRGIVVARTVVHNNNLDPEYDEILYVECHSPRDVFTIEVMDYQHLTKDRSLGATEFSVQGLLAEGPDKKTKPWVGTGKVSRTEMLKTDGRRTVKGNIEFEAEFFPCAHLKDISFTPPEPSKITELSEADESPAASAADLPSPPGTATTAEFASPPASPISETPGKVNGNGNGKKDDEDEGITIPRDELLKTQTGLLAFQVISGQLAKKGARLEVLFDDGYWPAFSTEASRSTHNTWDEIGEVLIRELDFSQIHLQLNTAEKDTRADVIATTTIDMNHFLEQSLDRQATFTLTATDGTGARSSVQIMSKYIPVEMQILPRESINNSGVLRVELLDGKGLPSADRNGKSDPYCVFELNEERVFKSEVVKKTLAPVWNEKFEVPVPSREAGKFVVEVFDWDRVGTADKLGWGTIDLRTIEPFESTERVVPLQDFKTGQPAGQIRIRMLFQVAFLRKERAATSTMSNIGGRIGTTLGGGVVGVGGAVVGVGGAALGGVGTVGKAGIHGVGAVGHVAGKGVSGVGRGVFGGVKRVAGLGHKRGESLVATTDGDAVPMPAPSGSGGTTPGGSGTAGAGYLVPGSPVVGDGASQVEVLAGSPNPNAAGLSASTLGGGRSGTLTLTVLQLSGIGEEGEKLAVEVRWGGKKCLATHGHKPGSDGGMVMFNEAAVVKTADGAAELSFAIIHKRTIGSDKTLASAVIPSIWEHVSPVVPSASVQLALGAGSLTVALEWIATPAFLGSPGSRAPSEGDARSITGSINGGPSPSTKARSRFSSGRFGRSRETTPSLAE
ncbi:hypothetical protein JCM10207_006938 [Rhodosporidiobolus poonsookiae]